MLTNHQKSLGNDFERAVISADEDLSIYPREVMRYTFASQFIKNGDRVLELGCSSGYGQRIINKDIIYYGMDYDKNIIDYASEQFPDGHYIQWDLEKEEIEGYYDVIIAYEVLEHLENGKQLAQDLKNHCNILICSVPYHEVPGFWGKHHKLHSLTEKDFPGFNYLYIMENGLINFKPERFEGLNLLLMTYENTLRSSD